jgi:hypothetical protein
MYQSINQTVKKIRLIFAVFYHSDEKRPTSAKKTILILIE